MDALKRIRMLRTSISSAIERLFHMEQTLEKAEQEALSLKAQISYLSRSMQTLRKPGIIVLASEWFLMKNQILEFKRRETILKAEILAVEQAQTRLEEMLESEENELTAIEASLEPRVVPFRRNDEQR